MKSYFTFFLLLVFTAGTNAQTDSTYEDRLRIPKGIYLSFPQVMSGEPERTDSIILKKHSEDDLMHASGLYSFKLASESKPELRKIKKTLVGISDGEFFYIADRYTVGGTMGMTRVISSGPYVIAPIQERMSKYTGGGLIPFMFKVGHGFLINLNRGISTPMTKPLLKALLDRYPAIWNEYSGKVDWYDMSPEIVGKVNVIARKELGIDTSN